MFVYLAIVLYKRIGFNTIIVKRKGSCSVAATTSTTTSSSLIATSSASALRTTIRGGSVTATAVATHGTTTGFHGTSAITLLFIATTLSIAIAAAATISTGAAPISTFRASPAALLSSGLSTRITATPGSLIRPTAPTALLASLLAGIPTTGSLWSTIASTKVSPAITTLLLTSTPAATVLASVTLRLIAATSVATATPAAATTTSAAATHAAATTSHAATTTALRVHFLLADGFLDIDSLAFDLVASLKNGFVYRVIIVKLHKPKTSGFAGVFFCQTSNGNNFSKLFKILSNIIFGHVLFETTNKNFFNRLSSLGLSKFFSRSSSFGFNRFSIDGMRSVRLTSVDLLVFGECNETESSGPLCIWKL